MRRVLLSALLAATVLGCSVVAPEYRPTPTPVPSVVASQRPDILGIRYDVAPLEVSGSTVVAAKKTALFFSNPNPFVVDWFMTVRFKNVNGLTEVEERIGNAGVPPDRADAKFQNWFFPIPPGDSWTVVRYDRTFAKSDVQEFRIARSISAIGEVKGVTVVNQACAKDADAGVIGCALNLTSTVSVPAFSKLHVVVLVRRTDSSRELLSALQWRPEIVASARPWFALVPGSTFRIEMRDGNPAPTVPWEYEVVSHVYQFPGQ